MKCSVNLTSFEYTERMTPDEIFVRVYRRHTLVMRISVQLELVIVGTLRKKTVEFGSLDNLHSLQFLN